MNILDCTIRDGSYVTGFCWDINVLKSIFSTLVEFGVKYIEIGNGTGLGAYRNKEGALSDIEYMNACMPIKKDALMGAFFIPKIGTKEDLELFRKEGGDFVRIGSNANDIDSTYEYIEYAKSLGYYVCCNVMKTYAISKFCLVKNVESVVRAGADCLYIVDSAGGMLPDQVADYVRAIKEFYDVSVGFHGHNNLSLANANSLSAIQAGAEFVDATMLGLGRGAGNAQIESLIAICQKAGLMSDTINVLELAEITEKIVGKMIQRGNTKRALNIGIVNFHDSYTDLLNKAASEYGVDPDRLMEEVSKINIINPTSELFEFAAARIKKGQVISYFPNYSHTKF